jgi:hypothetical protein
MLFAAAAIRFTCDGFETRAFSSDQWRADAHPFRVRRSMMSSLLRDHIRLGVGRAEIEGLLGPAESESWNAVYRHPGWEVAATWGGDSSAFIAKFDAQGRLVGYWSELRTAGDRVEANATE